MTLPQAEDSAPYVHPLTLGAFNTSYELCSGGRRPRVRGQDETESSSTATEASQQKVNKQRQVGARQPSCVSQTLTEEQQDD